MELYDRQGDSATAEHVLKRARAFAEEFAVHDLLVGQPFLLFPPSVPLSGSSP